MLKPMPFKFIKSFIPDNNNWSLNDKLFGFIKVEVTTSSNCNKILLPHRIDDKIVHSSGTCIETFFSEEIKLYLGKKNYKFRYLECYEFSKFYPFKFYVNTFYKIKAESKGIDRVIAKLLLNNLYGFFGRSYQLLKTFKINNNELNKSMNESEDIIINIQQFESYSIIKLIEINDSYQIKSNVAISSAITAWARIIMYPYLMLPCVIYSDTDSVFSTKSLDSKLIGKEIGKFKDEMNGLLTKEGKTTYPNN
uniref:DNA polymerase n=2 Tax=Polyozellus multiplex TaxID=281719 RepID=UPI001F142755|nr:DNA polymerase [Polyozellus multiplex]UMI33314.1 DNA polymerase [Polyozellus multiplex]